VLLLSKNNHFKSTNWFLILMMCRLPERGILSSDQQVLWLLARLFRKLKGTEHILLTKNAGFESLLTRLDAPENIAKVFSFAIF